MILPAGWFYRERGPAHHYPEGSYHSTCGRALDLNRTAEKTQEARPERSCLICARMLGLRP
jgi:hypothetical protein